MQGNPEEELKDHLIVDSGCSGSMTGENELLSDFKVFLEEELHLGMILMEGESLAKEPLRQDLLILRM